MFFSRISCSQYARCSGVRLARSDILNSMRASGGGATGMGCVGQGVSSGMSVSVGTGTSDFVDEALPVTRSSRNSIAVLFITAMAGMVLPFFFTLDERGGRQIEVPDIVMHGLEVPEILAGGCLDGDDGVAEQVGALAIAAPAIEGGRAHR